MNIEYSENFITIDFGKNYFVFKSCDEDREIEQINYRSRQREQINYRDRSRERSRERKQVNCRSRSRELDFPIINNIEEIKDKITKHFQKRNFNSIKSMLLHFAHNCYFKSSLFYSRKNYLEKVIKKYEININEDEVYEYILSFHNFSICETIFLFNILTINYENFDNFWETFLHI